MNAPSPTISNHNNSVLTVNFTSKKNNDSAQQLKKSISKNSTDGSFNKLSNVRAPDSSFKNNKDLSLLPLVQPKYYTIKELNQPPNIIENIDENPADLLTNKEGGSLTLQIKIDETGNVVEVKILKSTLPNKYAESATNSFLQKKFTPGLKGLIPVKSVLDIVVNYLPLPEISNK